MNDRIVAPALKNDEEFEYEKNIRPLTFNEYIGQERVKENLKVFIKAALMRSFGSRSFIWPTGLGKNNLSLYYSQGAGCKYKNNFGACHRAGWGFGSDSYKSGQ